MTSSGSSVAASRVLFSGDPERWEIHQHMFALGLCFHVQPEFGFALVFVPSHDRRNSSAGGPGRTSREELTGSAAPIPAVQPLPAGGSPSAVVCHGRGNRGWMERREK